MGGPEKTEAIRGRITVMNDEEINDAITAIYEHGLSGVNLTDDQCYALLLLANDPSDIGAENTTKLVYRAMQSDNYLGDLIYHYPLESLEAAFRMIDGIIAMYKWCDPDDVMTTITMILSESRCLPGFPDRIQSAITDAYQCDKKTRKIIIRILREYA